MKSLSIFLIFAAIALPGSAQPPPQRPAPVISPEVKADKSVAFRIKAPNAKEVSVHGQWQAEPLPLTRGEDDVWSAEAAAVPAGVWEYSFSVDGLNMLDPGNVTMKPMREPRTSILHIPAVPPAPWDFQDVPHGVVHQHGYLSKALGRNREIRVYTPPGYEKDTAAKYPLLVLQHGSGDNEQTWVAHGKAHWILDSLIAAGKARPMVVLMLDGHPFGTVSRGDAAKRGSAMDAFRRELFEDAIPLVESVYRLEKDASQRGIVGLSMGGGQSLTVGLGNPDQFAWIGSFSGAAPAELAVSADLNAKLRLLWIGCGKDDFLLKRNEDFIAKLKESGVTHQWHLTEGGHSWPVWRTYLADFLPLLFQPESR